MVMDYLSNKEADGTLKVLSWPSKSPDTNSIDNLRSILDDQCVTRKSQNEDQLFQILQEGWRSLPVAAKLSLMQTATQRSTKTAFPSLPMATTRSTKNSIRSHPIPQLWPMTQPNEDLVFDGDSRIDRVMWEAALLNTAPRFAQLSRGHAPNLITRVRCQLNNGKI